MDEYSEGDTVEADNCPREPCQCEDWPPDECPECGMTAVGFTPEDWAMHFQEQCNSLGLLLCFVPENKVKKNVE